MNNPTVRLIGRALVAGLMSGLMLLRDSSDWAAVWQAAVVAGVLAACEILTPLNPNVGVGKDTA